MAQIQVTFNGTATDLNDFNSLYGYSETIEDSEGESIPNPETKTQFFQRKVKEFVWESVKARRANKASEDARKVETDKIVNF